MALYFNGTVGRYIGLTGIPSMAGFSVCGTGKLTTDRNAYSTLFALETNDPGFSYIGMNTDTDGTTLCIQDAGDNTTLLSLAEGDTFFWCLTCTGAGTNTLKGYAGKLADTSLTTATRNVADIDTGTGYLRFGDNLYSEPFDGVLDNIIIYDSALTDAEVEAQRWRRLPIKQAWAWYPTINSVAADCYKDYSGNGRDLSAGSSAPTVIDGLPVSWGGVSQQSLFTGVALQTVSAITDSNAGTWLPSGAASLYEAIDEDVASNVDYIYTNVDGASRVKLGPLIDPASSASHTLSYQLRSPTGGNIRVTLYQGGGATLGAGTLIASYEHEPAPTSFTFYQQTLSGAEADTITDYTDLYVEFEKY